MGTYLTLQTSLILLFSISHWLVLFLGTRVVSLIPSWHWDPFSRPLTWRDGLFLVLAGLVLGLAAYARKRPQHAAWLLVGTIGLGYLLQVGFGWMSGGGMESIRMKYAGTIGGFYAHPVTQEALDPLQVIRNYEAQFGSAMFPGTKPPGVILVHVAFQRLTNFFDPQPSPEGRFDSMTLFMAYLSPLLAYLVLLLMYWMLRPRLNPAEALLPDLLYITIPSIVLMPVFLDTTLYPLIYLAGVLIVWQVVRKKSFLLAMLAGAYLYLALFLSFSLLPLAPLTLILIGLDVLTRPRPKQAILPAAKLALGLTVGFVALFLLFQQTLNYNFMERYQTSLRIVRNYDFLARTGDTPLDQLGQISSRPSISQIGLAAWRNNLEAASAVGFPIYFLFISGAVATLAGLARRRVSATYRAQENKPDSTVEIPLAAMALTYLAMNLYGQVQGEVSRLWAFNAPMMALLAGTEILRLFPRKNWSINLILTLQLITLWMTFHYQDYFINFLVR